MSRNPLENIKKRQAVERRQFPNQQFEEAFLAPSRHALNGLLQQYGRDVHRARLVDLCEIRSLKREDAAASLRALESEPLQDVPGWLALDAVEQLLAGVSGGQGLIASAPEEIIATASRLLLRDGLLNLHDTVLHLRGELARLALGHLTTAVTLTANGQMVQPTSLSHFLTGFLGPLQRASARLEDCWQRVNLSALGAVSGVSTAIPLRRERQAELLGFDGPVAHTFDALASADVEYELVSIVAGVSLEMNRLVVDLGVWARDDIGTIVPSEEFVHGSGAQPQRRDPLVLEHLRAAFAMLIAATGELNLLLAGRAMLGGSATHARTTELTHQVLTGSAGALLTLANVLKTLDVNRALTANRTHRGFATSSELVDLLTIDCGLSRNEARALGERIASEASILALGGMTLDTKLVDKLALEVVGREVGIEPETLGKCLSVKRFIERREASGGPAPSSVRNIIEREHVLRREHQAWLNDRWSHVHAARDRMNDAVASIAGSPALDHPDDRL